MADKKNKVRLASDADAEDAVLAIDQRVSLEKRGFFEKMGDVYEEDLFPTDWTKGEVEKAAKELLADRRFTSGFWNQVPTICRNECNHKDECRLSRKPLGQRCPEEMAFLELLLRKYMEDLKVTMSDMSSVSMIRDLCDLEIQIIRKQGILAREDLILDEPILDSRGDPTDYVRRVENPAIGMQQKLFREKADIMKRLVADRQSRLKAQLDVDKSDEMSRAVRALQQLRKAVERGQIIDNAPEDFVDAFVDAEYVEVTDTEPTPEEE